MEAPRASRTRRCDCDRSVNGGQLLARLQTVAAASLTGHKLHTRRARMSSKTEPHEGGSVVVKEVPIIKVRLAAAR